MKKQNEKLITEKSLKEKNKTLLSITAVLTAGCVFTTTAFVALAQNAGYEIYKNAVINMFTAQNYTMHSRMSMIYDDVVIAEEGSFQMIDGTTRLTKFFNVDTSLEDSYTYYNTYNSGMEIDGEGLLRFTYENNNDISNYQAHDEPSETYINLVNAGIDTLIGNIKNHVITEGNTVFINLTEAQIPALPQAFLAYLSEEYKRTLYTANPSNFMLLYSENESDISIEFPEEYANNYEKALKVAALDNLSVKNVEFVGEFDDNKNLKSIYGLAEIGGYEPSGGYDSIFIEVDIKISNFGTTVVEEPEFLGYAPDYYAYNSGKFINDMPTNSDDYSIDEIIEDFNILHEKGYAGTITAEELHEFNNKYSYVLFIMQQDGIRVSIPATKSDETPITINIEDEYFVSIIKEAFFKEVN